MANVHLHILSFNAGELSPLLGARFAVEKVGSGCRMLRNFIPHVHGPAFRRPGMEFMGGSAGDGARSRLLGFNFSTSTGFILEFHPAGLQVWSNGARVPLRNPVPLPYSEAECAELQCAQVNDVSYIAHPNHAPRQLIRYADDDWRLESITWVWPALGDENARSAEVATPDVAVLGTRATEQWPEFQFNGDYTFAAVNADTTSALKKAHLQRLTTSGWVNIETLTWTTSAPADITGTAGAVSTWRITYAGPVTATASISVTWGTGSSSLPLSVAQPAALQPITVPPGEWQYVVVCPATLPAGARLTLQRKTGSTWADFKAIPLRSGQTLTARGATLTAATDFRFVWAGRPMAGSARLESVDFPDADGITVAASATTGTVTLTASSALFQAGHVGSFWQISHRRDVAFAQIVAAQPTIAAASSSVIRVSGKWDVFTYGIWSATLFLERKVGSVWEIVRSWSSRKDRNVIASGEESGEVEMRLRVTAGTSTASDTADVPRFVLEASDARVYGLVKITAVGTLDATGKSLTATATVLTTLHSTDATPLWTEGAWSGVKGYPRALAIHGGRLWFGGTSAEPLRLWGSVANDYLDFRRSSLDDAGVSFTAAAQQSNALQWMASHGADLILGTSGDEWTLSAQSGVVTPSNVQMQRRSGYGSRYLPALLLGESVVFVQRGGRKLRGVSPRSESVTWSAADLTVLAEHVTASGIVQTAVMNFPYSILWAVTTDGRLLGMTYETEQNVFGWHVHATDGFVESVAVVYGAESDEVWLCVVRSGRRFIERLDPRVFARAFDAPSRLIYLDSAVRFESAQPTDTLTGLEHLEGRTVSVLGDGAELAPVRVVSGQITVERPVSVAIVGLPFTSTLQPMRMDVPLQSGTSKGRNHKAARVVLDLHESLGGEVASAPDARPERINYRTVATPMDAAPPLFTGDMQTAIESTVRPGFDVIVRTSGPHPFNVGSLTIEGDVYGD